MKKLLSLIVVLALALSALSLISLQAGALTWGDYEYELIDDDTHVCITRYTGYEQEKLEIPDTIDGKPVTGIGLEAFEDCEATTIIVPDTVTFIEEAAFGECHCVETITLGNQVAVIGESAFYSCGCLKNLALPASLTTIGNYAFDDCYDLTAISIPAATTSIGVGLFESCIELSSFTVEAGNPVYHSAGNCIIETASKTLIAGCKTSVIPDDGSVTRIGDMAFWFIEPLESINIPDTVTYIGEDSFSGTSLTSLIIPRGVIEIGDEAFDGCDYLTSVTISNTVTTIGKGVFSDCEAVSSVTVEAGNPAYHSAGNCIIETESKTLIAGFLNSVIPDDGSVTRIGAEAFYCFSHLSSVTIPSGVTALED